MNKTLITLAVAAASTLTALPSFAATSVKATVNGMVCAFCAQGIEKRISNMSATKEVFVDLKQKTVAIEAKDGQTLDTKAIAAEIVEAGYDVVKLETVQQSVAEIKAAMKDRK
ncbi:MAG: heavy-metal-associated domain-containing protein [Rhodoferax sp.]|nr:heavy-metal-associated domain-containing protein [Rhodoferax sp.]